MSEVEALSKRYIKLLQHMGSDEGIAQAASVSTGKPIKPERVNGLIRYLLKEGHTSPFEHAVVTFEVEAPIFVAREWERHRTQSYSELSLRYSTAVPKFYIPSPERPLVQEGTGAHPKLVMGTEEQWSRMSELQYDAYLHSWQKYKEVLDEGIAGEVARNVLPLATYTKFQTTANLNNWFKFLHLRLADNAQWEIRTLAEEIVVLLTDIYPLTMYAWNDIYN